MTNRVTVAEMMAALSKMPPTATVTVRGSYETYDGYSHPEVTMDSDGEVVISEADEPEDYVDDSDPMDDFNYVGSPHHY
jgi:hypothetical protein